MSGVLVAIILVLGVGGWFIQAQGNSEDIAVTPEKVTLGLAPDLNHLILIALEQDYFSAEKLEVTLKEYDTGSLVLDEGLLKGEVEVGVVGLGPLVFKSFERQDFKIFGSISTIFDLYKIVAAKDQDILTAADLRGKRLATSEGSSFHYFAYNFLIENGLTDEDVEFVFKKAGELPEALATGEVDAICTREPFISEAQELLGDNAVVLSEPSLPANTLNLVGLDGFIQNRPQVAARLLRALKQAEVFAKANPDEAIKIVAKQLDVDESEVAEGWPQIILEVTLGQELILNLENIAQWAIRAELVDSDNIPNYLDYIYLEGMEAVEPGAVTIIK
jgi:NitT/TauT family transport system substrate-binding protein